jgi:hypothetical protein
MATNYYVDWSKADDSGAGTSWATAKKHLSAMIAALPDPVTDQSIIWMKGTVASPVTYGETGNVIYIAGLQFKGAVAELVVQPEEWQEANYQAGGNPYVSSGGTFDPTATKPVIIPTVLVGRTGPVTLKGLKITSNQAVGVHSYAGAITTLSYCAVTDIAGAGVSCDTSEVTVLNSYLYNNDYGAVVAHKGILQFQGENTVKDSEKCGVLAQVDSLLQFRAWLTLPSTRYLTKINTTSARNEYQAIKAVINSTVMICDQPNDDTIQIGQVKILDEHLMQSKDYYGVVLESASRVIGAGNIVFWDANINSGKDTVPPTNRLAAAAAEGITVVD